MADYNQEFVFSNDPIMIIAQYLSPKDLSALKSVSHLVNNNALTKVALLQPLYNRLYAIDKTLPALLSDLDSNNPFLAFKQAFEKIQTQQQQEIVFFKKKHPKLKFPEISGSPVDILEQTDIFLNEINIDIIRQAVEDQPGTNLILYKNITRFMIPNDCKDYFANLKKLDFGLSKMLTTLNLQGGCPALQELGINLCNLTTLNIQGSDALRKLNWVMTNITTLDLKGYVKLEELVCIFSPSLIFLNLEDCIALQKIHCDKWELVTLNLKNCAEVQNCSFQYTNITELNIQGASQQVQNTLGSLEEKLLFKKLSDATYVERDEIIERLGERYNSTNCIKYGCFYEVASLGCQYINSFMPYFSIPQKEDLFMDVENKNKRKRESDNNNEGVACKRNKPD